MPAAITFAELEQKFADLDISDDELAKYFVQDPERLHVSRPFKPALQIDPELVRIAPADEVRAQAAIVGEWVNSLCRARRRKRFRAKRASGSQRPVVVAEGDSWFQFPLFLEDVIDQLENDYDILCCSAAGDTLQNMILENAEYMDTLDEASTYGKPAAFLFSGGGNDIIGADKDGVSALQKLVRAYDPGKSAEDHLDEPSVAAHFAYIRRAYELLIRDVRKEFKNLPIFFHAYGHVFPGNYNVGGVVDHRAPFYARRDQWIGAPLRAKGITDVGFQRKIVGVLIDRFLSLLNDVAASNSGIHIVDAVDQVTNLDEWNDEIHPTDLGFKRVADVFRTRIDPALS